MTVMWFMSKWKHLPCFPFSITKMFLKRIYTWLDKLRSFVFSYWNKILWKCSYLSITWFMSCLNIYLVSHLYSQNVPQNDYMTVQAMNICAHTEIKISNYLFKHVFKHFNITLAMWFPIKFLIHGTNFYYIFHSVKFSELPKWEILYESFGSKIINSFTFELFFSFLIFNRNKFTPFNDL